MLPLQTQVPCEKLGACSFATQMLAHVETPLLLSHPRSRVATGRDTGGGDGTPCDNSPGSAGMGVSSPWVGGRDVSRGCVGQAWVCLGRRQACCLGAASCCCRCLGGNRRFYLPFSSPLALPGWLALSGLRGGAVLRAATCNSQYLALEMQQGCKPRLRCQCPRRPVPPGQMVTAFTAFSALSAASAFVPREVCAPLGMQVIPAGRVPSSVLLPGEPGEGCRVRHFRAKPFLRY